MQAELEKLVLLTLGYTFQFGYPLTIGDVFLRLISISNTKITKKQFLEVIHSGIKRNIFSYSQGFLFFGSAFQAQYDISKLVALRKKRTEYSRYKLQEAEKFVRLVSFIPFITGIAVTGSVAVGNARSVDDIDFMIITQKNRLWITRLCVWLLVSWVGKRRAYSHLSEDTPIEKTKQKNSWCLNLWLEETALQMPVKSRSIYEAYEVVQAVWLYERGEVKKRFLLLNKWAAKFMLNYWKTSVKTPVQIKRQVLLKIPLVTQLLDFCNYLFYLLEYSYMKSRITREKVSLRFAFFHPRDTKKKISQQFKYTLFRFLHGLQAKNSTNLPEYINASIRIAHKNNSTIVLVTGVFDVLHSEHVAFLNKAKLQGDVLIIGVESDKRVRQIKGEGRPIHTAEDRVGALLELGISDQIFILPDNFSTPQDHTGLIQTIKPSVLAVSSHTKHLDKKKQILASVGGVVSIVHDHNPGISTTQILSTKMIQ